VLPHRRRRLAVAIVLVVSGLVAAPGASSSPTTAVAFVGRLMRPADRPDLVFRRFSSPVATWGPAPALETARRSFEVGPRATSVQLDVTVWIRLLSGSAAVLALQRDQHRAAGSNELVRATRVGHGSPAWSVRAKACTGTCTARLEWENIAVIASVQVVYPSKTHQWSQIRTLLQRLADIQDARIVGAPDPGDQHLPLGSCVPATPGACGPPTQGPAQPVGPRPWA
jgi:hypothetical protein